MIELFSNIPTEVKKQIETTIDLVFKTLNPFQINAFLSNYKETCTNDEEKQFIDFLVQLRLEKYRNENNSN